jgi:hypothetical protein
MDTIKPWFFLREKLAAVLIIPSSWGSQLDGQKPSTPCRISMPRFYFSAGISKILLKTFFTGYHQVNFNTEQSFLVRQKKSVPMVQRDCSMLRTCSRNVGCVKQNVGYIDFSWRLRHA